MVKKAHLVTGKGGVGKSLFAAVLAQHLSNKTTSQASQKQKILLTELNEHSFYKDYLNLPGISYHPTPWKPHIDVAQWAPEECLKEYALHLLKIESLYKLFIENPVTKSLIEVAPGLQDLALLGKLTSSPRRHGPPMNYDEIVVDSFSTGHFLSMLRAPAALQEAIPFGPMGEQTKSIDLSVRDANFTEVHIVCLAEELPVTESVELYQQLKKEFGITAKFYLNKISDLKKENISDITPQISKAFQTLIQNEEEARVKLKNANITFQELSLIASQDTEKMFSQLLLQLENAK